MTSCSAFISLNENTVSNNNGPNFHECFLCVRHPRAKSFSSELGPLLWNVDGLLNLMWMLKNFHSLLKNVSCALKSLEFFISTVKRCPKNTSLQVNYWDMEEGTLVVTYQQFKNKPLYEATARGRNSTEKLWGNPILPLNPDKQRPCPVPAPQGVLRLKEHSKK